MDKQINKNMLMIIKSLARALGARTSCKCSRVAATMIISIIVMISCISSSSSSSNNNNSSLNIVIKYTISWLITYY